MSEHLNTLFLNSAFAGDNSFAFVSIFFLFCCRMFPILAHAPFFGARVLPFSTKIAFAICLFVIFLPKLLTVVSKPPMYDTLLIFMCMKELVVGYVIGLLVSTPFNIIQATGIFIDNQRGAASLMVNDPAVQNQSSPLGTMFNLVLICIFYYVDGPFLFIEGLITSYEVIPPDRFLNPLLFEKGSMFWDISTTLLNKMMTMTIQLASPALIAILMTDLFLGIANRLAPQVQVTFLGMPLKSLLGLFAVTLGWNLFIEEVAKQSLYWVYTINKLVLSFKVT